ncbi:MAG: hypothetical protein K2K04_02070 [Clostridia bacterium]|nr:hypothetical protein [Clostridia bacterium]
MKIKKLILPIALLCAVSCLCGCSGNDGGGHTGDENDEIKTAYAEKYNVPVSEVFYTSYGEYNGAHAIMIASTGMGAGDAITYDTIGSATFTYSSTHKMDVYYDGDFYSLTAAYNSGWLTMDNVRSIADRYGRGARYLTVEEEAEIIAAYRQSLEESAKNGAEIEISSYYGIAGGYKAVSVGIKGTAPYKDKTETITVDGELYGKEYHSVDKISFHDAYGIQLYKDGAIYTLKYAMENKLISLDDYMEISSVNGFAWKS